MGAAASGMKLLTIGVLAVFAVGLLAAAVLIGYRQDQQVIYRFAGTGIAGKVDVFGTVPDYVLIEGPDSRTVARVALASNGTFVARLDPGSYSLQLPQDSRRAQVVVPSGQCLDLVLDFRLPALVLEIPGEGWPVPKTTT
jgi:hypothetical protein